MAYVQLGLVDLMAAIQTKVQDKTGLSCYDFEPENLSGPFYFAQVAGKHTSHSKTMWRDIITVEIHAVAESKDSSVQMYELIQDLEEALTEKVELPEGFELLMQTNNKLQVLKNENTKEKHAVLTYEFIVSYGFSCKV